MKIILPLPPSILSGHAKGMSHWTVSRATKAAKTMAWIEGLNVRGQEKPCRAGRMIKYYFYVKDKRVRDTANMIHGCKAYVDGLVKAGVIWKDDWVHLTFGGACVAIDKANPRVELEIE